MKKEKEKKVKEKKVKEKAVSEPKPEGRVREFLCGAVFSLLVGVGAVNIALVGLLFCFLYGFPQLPLVSELSTYHTSANTLPQGGSGMSQSNSLFGSLSADSAGQSSAVQANTTPVSQGDETPKQTAPASGGNQQEAAQQQEVPSQNQADTDGGNPTQPDENIPANTTPNLPVQDDDTTPSKSENNSSQSSGEIQAPSSPEEHTIYVTNTGKRYHYDDHCNGGTYYPSTLEEAERRGLTPCNKCVL